MKETQQPQGVSGSLTPHLEGAERSLSHPERMQPKPHAEGQKGNTEHE